MAKKDIDKTQLVDAAKIKETLKKEEDSEMDTSFVEKERGSAIAKIILLLFVVLIIVAGVYYFLTNNTKKMYQKYYDGVTNVTKTTSDKINLSYKLNVKMTTNDKSLKKIANVIEKIVYEGSIVYENDNLYTMQHMTYEDDEMLRIALLKKGDRLYFEFPDALDKPIDYSQGSSTEYYKTADEYKDYYEDIKNGVVKAVRNALETAEYQKTLVKVDNKYVKKSTLIIDNKFVESIYTNILHDDNTIKSIAALQKETESKVIDNINKEIADLESGENKIDYSIAIYTTIISNEFVKLEADYDTYKFNVTKSNDMYNFEYLENYLVRAKGNVTINGKNDKYLGTLTLSLVKEKIDLSIDYDVNLNDTGIKALDPSKAVTYDKLSKTDISKLNSYLSDNKTLNKFLKDIGY